MPTNRLKSYSFPLIILVWLITFAVPAADAAPLLNSAQQPADSDSSVYTCPTTSSNSYSSGIMYQYDNDNPVRPAYNHADKNLALRSYSSVSHAKTFIDYGSDDPTQPPQFATLFNPSRVPTFSTVYAANNWNWQSSPNPGTRGSAISVPPVTVLGLETTPGEVLRAPTHGRNIGADFGTGGSMVIFADADSITLKFTREDTAATGYTVHIDNICTDPNLLALYNSLDNSARNTYSASRPYSYNLPGLTAGKAFGTARDTEIRVAIVDTGSFQDPRSRFEWWQIAPAATATPTVTRTPTGPTNTSTVTLTRTNTPTITSTPTRTNTATVTLTRTITNTPTITPIPPVNLALNKSVTANSGTCSASEIPSKAVDGSVTNNSKWCTFGSSGQYWLRVDLGAAYNLGQLVVKHAQAGGESVSQNTRDFQLQVSNDGTNFTTVASVSNNTQAQTTHTLSPVSARYVRIWITAPEQSGSGAARIYELEVYGPTGPTATPTVTATATSTRTATNTATPTVTLTPLNTATRTLTPTITPTPTITNTPTRTNTATITNTATRTPTITNTPLASDTPTRTATATPPPVNLALNKSVTANSGTCSASEIASKAVDGSVTNNSKWCTFGSSGQYWLRVDLGAAYSLGQLVVKHAQAGGESVSQNTRDFQLQVSNDGTNFTTVASVSNNTQAQTTHTLSPVSARYVRIWITAPEQSGSGAARIYELEVYGPTGPTATPTITPTVTNTQTPAVTNTVGVTNTPTQTLTAAATNTFTPTPTATTNTPTPTATTNTPTPTVTSTALATNTPTATVSPSTNLALNKATTADSAPCKAAEAPAKAVDGSVINNSKWCSFGSGGQYWLRVDLGASYNINQFVVKHAQAGGESASQNTRDFQLQVSADGTNWTTVVTVTGNTQQQTTHAVSTSGRYVRLLITAPEQSGSGAARIYELEVYGN